MGDLKPIWDNIPAPTPGLEGDVVTERGTDPNITIDQPNALSPFWSGGPQMAAPVPQISGEETANPVSSLPLRPARFEETGRPPAPPSLQDRSPGTIDEQ